MPDPDTTPRAVLISAGSWYLRQTGRALQNLGALAGLYVSDKNTTGIRRDIFHRCWQYHLAVLPFCLASGRRVNRWEPMWWRLLPVWNHWLKRQRIPECNIIHAIGPFATEAFDIAKQSGALKVFDAANSHPLTQNNLLDQEFKKWIPDCPMPAVSSWYIKRATADIKRADLILCPSTFVFDSMIHQGVPKEKCALLPFGADPSLFRPRQEVPDKLRFVCVGTLCLRKGHQYLFPAFEKVKRDMPDAELICVGDIRQSFLPIYRQLRHLFTHIPHIPHADLTHMLQTSTAFVMPSIEEGYARVIGEALASGLPVIATHESGATTTISDGQEGLVVSRCAVDELASAMLKLGRDRRLNETMGRRAAIKAGELTWDTYGERLLSAYSSRLKAKEDNVSA